MSARTEEPINMEQLMFNYKTSFTWNLIKFIIITIIAIVIAFFTLSGGGLADIVKNWAKYRCNPIIMPFASLFGQNASENFNFCMKTVFQGSAGSVLGPFYSIMSNFMSIIKVISNVANSLRYLIANLLHGAERFIGNFRDRFQAILFQIRYSFIRIRQLMGRVFATFQAVTYMGISGLRAADNLAHNGLIEFLMEFCFDPNTLVQKADGTIVPLHKIRIGDSLTAGKDGICPVVTSIFEFDGSSTPTVLIGDVIVSASHYVLYKPLDKWIKASEHPDSNQILSLPKLMCLNTSTHTVEIGNYTFSDYDESSTPEINKTTQQIAEKALNGSCFKSIDDYSLGIHENTYIRMADQSKKLISEIQIGDRLDGNSRVLGLVKESCAKIVIVDDVTVSSAQLLWHNGLWVRAGNIKEADNKPTIMYQLITENNIIKTDQGTYLRDYREVSDPDMERPYEDNFEKVKN